MLVEVLLDLLLAGLRRPAGKLLRSKGEVGNLALFRNGCGVARGILLEEAFQVALRWIDRLAQVVRRDRRIIELDPDVVLAIALADLLVAHRHPRGDQRAHGGFELDVEDVEVVQQFLFKFRNRLVELIGDEGGIPVGSDELAAGKKVLAELAFVQELDHVVVGGVNAQLLRFGQQNLLLHQTRAGLLLEVVDDKRRLRQLLPQQLPPRKLAHPLLADHLARRQIAAVPVWVDGGIRIGGYGALTGREAGDQIDHHAHRCGGNDEDEKRLGQAIVSLQETDHGWT